MKSDYGIYGQAAVKAVNLLIDNPKRDPEYAWATSICKLTQRPTSRKKACPKHAFIGLCVGGLIKNVSTSIMQKSVNADYAINAVAWLRNNQPESLPTRIELWDSLGIEKAPNAQMHVVLALWSAGKLKGSKPQSS